MIKRYPIALGLTLAALAVPGALAAPSPAAQTWTVDQGGSSLEFIGVAEGEEFNGAFGNWSAQINFDPEHLDWSAVEVTIDLTSADTGDSSRDGPLQNNDWFWTAMYPNASFKTQSITAEGDGSYVAQATLTIRDHTEEVTLPFKLAIDGDKAAMTGTLVLDRTAFGIGNSSYLDKNVDPQVAVDVALTATKG